MTVKEIMGVVPAMHSIALVSKNIEVASKKKPTSKDMTGLAMHNIVGTSLIKAESDLIAGL